MIGSMNLQQVQSATGGELTGGDAVFDAISIDTRTLEPGELFLAIKGPNFNGNEFVATAAQAGACGAIVSEEVESDLPVLRVADTRRALGTIGAMNRQRSSARVIALTGSQGKTTVKEMTAAILAHCGEVAVTSGNLNNELGVPLTLSRIEAQHEFAVIEMGANGPGEIAYMTGLASPDIAHITLVAGTHLEGFGSLEGVARAKGEIWQGIRKGGTGIVNLDDQFAGRFIKQIERQGDRQVVSISGQGKDEADYSTTDIHLEAFRGAVFTLRTPRGSTQISLQVPGRHNVSNALAAAAMAMSAGAGLEEVRKGLEQFSPVKGRMAIVPGLKASTVIDDSYNASPSSFRAAIDVLAVSEGISIVVMGDMGELGNEEQAAHREIGEYARRQGVDHFIGIGPLSSLAVEAFGEGAVYLETQERFAEVITPLLDASVTVLVKGSRSQGMEKLVAMIQAGSECA